MNGDARQPQLQGEWGKFIAKVAATRTTGVGFTPFTRLSQKIPHLPGFAPNGGNLSICVLAPVESRVDGRIALPRLHTSKDDKTTNGNSVLPMAPAQ